jgi:hypothetical protein
MSERHGVTNACPKCGGTLKALASRCELCGYELADVGPNRTVTELVRKFDEIEAVLTSAGLQGSKLEAELRTRRARVIRDFPVPNARDDLLSLIHFILPKLQGGSKPDPNVEDWRVKFKEVMSLAKHAYKGDVTTREELEALERTADVTVSGAVKGTVRRNPLLTVAIGVVGVLVALGFVSTRWEGWQQQKCDAAYAPAAQAEKARLEAIVLAFNGKLQQKDYVGAQVELNQLHWTHQEACKVEAVAQETAVWERKRQQLFAQIEEAQRAERTQQQAEADKLRNQQQAAENQVKEEEMQKQRAIAAKAEARRLAEAEADLTARARQGSMERQSRGE